MKITEILQTLWNWYSWLFMNVLKFLQIFWKWSKTSWNAGGMQRWKAVGAWLVIFSVIVNGAKNQKNNVSIQPSNASVSVQNNKKKQIVTVRSPALAETVNQSLTEQLGQKRLELGGEAKQLPQTQKYLPLAVVAHEDEVRDTVRADAPPSLSVQASNISSLIADSLTATRKSKEECIKALEHYVNMGNISYCTDTHYQESSTCVWARENAEILAAPECQEKVTRKTFEERFFDMLKNLQLDQYNTFADVQNYVYLFNTLVEENYKGKSIKYDIYHVLMDDYGFKVSDKAGMECADVAIAVIGGMVYYQALKQGVFSGRENVLLLYSQSIDDRISKVAKKIQEKVEDISNCRDVAKIDIAKIKKFLDDLGEFYVAVPKNLMAYWHAQEQEQKEKQAQAQAKKEQEYEKKQKEYALYVEAIKSGKQPIENVSDAVVFYDANQDYFSLIRNLPLSATGQNYLVRGVMKLLKNNILIFDAGQNDYFALKLSKIPVDMRLNIFCDAVGTHIGNQGYTTLVGEKIMPLLDALYVSCQ